MTDEVFIKEILQRGEEAKEKVKKEFSGISLEQLNWKPLPESWSIAQCLHHLIASDSSYFFVLKKITDRSYKMVLWEKFSPFSRMWGRLLKDYLQVQVRKKLKAPKKFQPPVQEMKPDLLEQYYRNLDTLLRYIAACATIDIDKIIITSPAIRMVTYNLRDTFSFLLHHEHRHINQAIRVKVNEGFPKK